MMNLGTCHISGCGRKATHQVAPNVAYCSRHAKSNMQATASYLRAINQGGLRIAMAEMAKKAFIREAVIGPNATAEHNGVRYHVVIGTQYDPEIIAVKKQGADPDDMADYFFRPGEPRYTELLQVLDRNGIVT